MARETEEQRKQRLKINKPEQLKQVASLLYAITRQNGKPVEATLRRRNDGNPTVYMKDTNNTRDRHGNYISDEKYLEERMPSDSPNYQKVANPIQDGYWSGKPGAQDTQNLSPAQLQKAVQMLQNPDVRTQKRNGIPTAKQLRSGLRLKWHPALQRWE